MQTSLKVTGCGFIGEVSHRLLPSFDQIVHPLYYITTFFVMKGQLLIILVQSVTIQDFAGRLQPSDIRVFPEVAEVEPDETVQLLAMAVDANGVVIPNRKINWEILRPIAGSISQDGRFTAGTAIGEFSQTIRVTMVDDGAQDQPAITTGLDVRVLDPAGESSQVSAAALPRSSA